VKPTRLPTLDRRIFSRKPDRIKSVLLAVFIGYCCGWLAFRWLAA